jgi:hypothetical protein
MLFLFKNLYFVFMYCIYKKKVIETYVFVVIIILLKVEIIVVLFLPMYHIGNNLFSGQLNQPS